MPTYNDLRPDDDFLKRDYELVFPRMTQAEKKRTIENLLVLRAGLDLDIAARKTEHNLLIGSWNIKEFGHTDQRLPEAFFYTAEIVNRLDLLVVQEVKSTMDDLRILMRLLGDDWAYLVNDITEGTDGNSERGAYLYNKRRVELGGLAGEIVLWDDLTKNSPIKQLKRTPYITGFKAGWKTFAIVNLHLHPGDDADDVTFRREEVRLLLAAIAKKTADQRLWNENLILAGDFNLYAGATKDDPTIAMINTAGFHEVDSLVGVDTNVSQTEAYDRLFLSSEDYFQVVQKAGKGNGGVFPLFDYVFRAGTEAVYLDEMKEVYTGTQDLDVPAKRDAYFKNFWRKNQMSDHLPIWFELKADSSDEFLTNKLASYP